MFLYKKMIKFALLPILSEASTHFFVLKALQPCFKLDYAQANAD